MKIMRVILNGIMIAVGNKCKQWNEKLRNYNKTFLLHVHMYIQGMDGRYSNICFKEVWNNNKHFYKTLLGYASVLKVIILFSILF
jgi:hypothetical protein